ncbi:hypothetical protein PG984_001465 [Apiospora sp. TS-2023a]
MSPSADRQTISSAGIPTGTSVRAYVIPQKRKRSNDDGYTNDHEQRRKRSAASLESATEFDDAVNKRRISDLEEQLAAKDAQLHHRIAEIDDLHDKQIKYQLQVQIRDEKIAKQSSELKAITAKNQLQAARIQQSEITINQQAAELERRAAKHEQSSVSNQLLAQDNAALRARHEELQRSLLKQEILNELGRTIASALSNRSVADNNPGQQPSQSQSDSPTQDRQIKKRLDKFWRKCRVLKDPDEE